MRVRAGLVERATDDIIEVPRAGQVRAEGLLHDHPRPAALRAGLVEAAGLQPAR